MPEDTNEPTNPASDEQSVYAKAATGEPSISPPIARVASTPTRDQLRSLVDVFSADVRRAIKNPIKPADVELLGRVAERAAKLTIEIRTTPADADAKVVKKLQQRRTQIESQLAGIKSIGSALPAKRFWVLLDAAIDRLTSFAVTAAIAAI